MRSTFNQNSLNSAGRSRLGALISFFFVVWIPAFNLSAAADWERKCPPKPHDIREARKLASRLYRTGITHYKRGRYDEAENYFLCTQYVLPAVLTKYWIGRVAEKLGKYEEALNVYLEVEKDPPKVVDVDDLKRRILRLGDRVGEGLGVDDQPDSMKKGGPDGDDESPSVNDKDKYDQEKGDPGKRVFHEAALYRRYRSMEIAAWTTWSAGAVMILTGTVLGSLALHDQRKIENAADGVYWDSGLEKRYERRQGLVPGAWVCIGFGIAAVASGTILYLFGRREIKDVPTARLQMMPLKGGAAAGVRLRY